MSRPSLFEENNKVFSRNRRTVKIQTCEHRDKKYSHQNTNGDIDTKFRKVIHNPFMSDISNTGQNVNMQLASS